MIKNNKSTLISTLEKSINNDQSFIKLRHEYEKMMTLNQYKYQYKEYVKLYRISFNIKGNCFTLFGTEEDIGYLTYISPTTKKKQISYKTFDNFNELKKKVVFWTKQKIQDLYQRDLKNEKINKPLSIKYSYPEYEDISRSYKSFLLHNFDKNIQVLLKENNNDYKEELIKTVNTLPIAWKMNYIMILKDFLTDLDTVLESILINIDDFDEKYFNTLNYEILLALSKKVSVTLTPLMLKNKKLQIAHVKINVHLIYCTFIKLIPQWFKEKIIFNYSHYPIQWLLEVNNSGSIECLPYNKTNNDVNDIEWLLENNNIIYMSKESIHYFKMKRNVLKNEKTYNRINIKNMNKLLSLITSQKVNYLIDANEQISDYYLIQEKSVQ